MRPRLVRNGLLICVALAGLGAASSQTMAAAPGGVVVAAVAGLVVGGLVTVFDDIADLFRPTSTSHQGQR